MAYDSSLYRLPDPNIDPNAPGFTVSGYRDVAVGTKNRLNTGSTISVSFKGNYWELSISYPELSIEEANYISPKLSYISNGFKPIYVQLPQFIEPKSGAWDLSTAALRAEGAISIKAGTSDTVSVTSWSTRGGDLDTGDMIKFTNSSKIYQVVDLSVNRYDVASIVLHCDIIEPEKIPSAGFEVNDIKFRVKLKDGTPMSSLSSKLTYDPISLTFEEDLE
jgi:hypothetical protein